LVFSLEHIFLEFRNWLISDSNLTWNQSRHDWTREIKAFFGQLGERNECVSIYTGVRPRESEYLLDLVWKVQSPRRYLELGLESELSGNRARIMRAFEKLLDVKANIKVGLFRLNSDIEDDIIQTMQEKMLEQAYPVQTENYLVIFLRYIIDANQIEIHGCKIFITGRQEDIERNCYPFEL